MHPDGLSLDIDEIADLCDENDSTEHFAAEIELLYRLIECIGPGVCRHGPMLVRHLLEPMFDVAFVLRLRGAISASNHVQAARDLTQQGFIPNKQSASLVIAHLHEAIKHAVMTQHALAALCAQ